MDKACGKTAVKYAFTLAETLTVIIVIGVISVLAIKLLHAPDKNKIMFKKAYNTLEKSVTELINDEILYPYNANHPGFLNDKVVEVPGNTLKIDNPEGCAGGKECALQNSARRGAKPNKSNNAAELYQFRYTSEDHSGLKFDVLLMDKLSISSVEEPCPEDVEALFEGKNNACFTTSDGIGWAIENADFGIDKKQKKLIIDVNGFKKEPNVPVKDKPDGDRFEVAISYDGKILPVGDVEKKFVTDQSLQ